MGSGKHRWRLSFHRSPSSSPSPTPDPPPEFVCPLASTLMADPVVVPPVTPSERSAIQACNDLHFVPPIISSFQASPLISSSLTPPLRSPPSLTLGFRAGIGADLAPASDERGPGQANLALHPAAPRGPPPAARLPVPSGPSQRRCRAGEPLARGEEQGAGGAVRRSAGTCGSAPLRARRAEGPRGGGDLQPRDGGREQGRDRGARRRAAAAPPLLPAIRGGSRSAGCDSDLPPLSLSSSNKARVVKTPGVVKAVLAVAKEGGKVLCVLASGHDGRTLMMDAGAVAALVEILKKEVEEEKEKRCVAVIYGMSRGSGWRFRGLARAAGAEEVVVRVAEKGCSGEEVREMAKKAVRAR
ncbi:hypothetical protein J5N97_005098 [Dioscorea zingiberensis]|uniref:U-box domain-containing protein n=1 Tax=Dioscorea zingiberensis TaxID=325984 RepID=A0A9D5D9X9_9LILI|nr:hypothetical protein J5N97_005098 [Dioscorea zingiberensis]